MTIAKECKVIMRWQTIRVAHAMPAGFMNYGIQSSNGRFFVGARYTDSYTGRHLNWGVLDFKTGTVTDNFRYRRDAKRYVEMGCSE